MVKKRIYLDHAAATPMDPRVKAAMEPYLKKQFGNPSAIYEEGRVIKKAIADARLKVAELLNARPDEIIFTCGGTESDNMAIFGIAGQHKEKGNHIITSKIEHHAVLHSCQQLEKEGFKVDYIGVDKDGLLDLRHLKSLLKPPARRTAPGAVGGETILVSIMLANNEIGTIQPIVEIAKIIRQHRKKHGTETPYFHTDAVQAPPYIDLNVLKFGVDLMTLNGSKIYGPKSTGCLFKKRGLKIQPLIHGGGQEMKLRPGTENVPGIIGFRHSLEFAQKEREKECERLIKLRDYFIERILKEVPDVVLNGSEEIRLPNNINVSFLNVEGEAIILYLDAKGIAASTGSACSSDSLEPSHVVRALKRPYKYAHGSVRFSLGKSTTKQELDYVLKVLPEIIKKLRGISALH